MATVNVSVSPDLLAGGVPVSLVGLAPTNLITLSGNAPTALPSTLPSVGGTAAMITAQWAINLGFGSLASLDVTGSAAYYLWDFTVLCDPVPGKGGLIVNEYYGAGLRVCVKVWNLQTSASATVLQVAAACTLNAASSSYEIAVLGLDLAALGDVAPVIGGSVGAFDASAVERLGTMVTQITAAILAGGAHVHPVLLAVDIDPTSSQLAYAKAASTSYALQAILVARPHAHPGAGR